MREVSGEFANAIAVSAKSGENVDVLLKMISGFFSERFSTVEVKLPNTRMDLVNMLYEQGKVIDVQYNQKTVKVKLTLAKPLLEKLASYRDIQIC